MISLYKKYFCLVVFSLSVMIVRAQTETNCDPLASLPVSQGEIIVNYGSVTNAFSFRNRSSFTVGQAVVGSGVGKEFTSQTGFWTRFLLPPKAPQVIASQGDFPDRVLMTWNLDPLSADPFDGYVVTRDGAFLTQVDRKINQFIDFNVQAGEIYDYGVYGRNKFGNGSQGKSYGFVNPNGVITGLVSTPSANAVPGAIIRLTPIVGTAMLFDGVDDHLCITHTAKIPNQMWTVSAWVKIGATHDSDGIIDFGSDINKNFWIHTTPSAMTKGVVIGTGDGIQRYEIAHEFATNVDGWHQVTAVYAAGSLLLYVDGKYVSSIKSSIAQEDALVTIGSRRNQTGFFDGRIDDVRIYNRPLTSTEILLTKDLAVSKKTNGLVAYWKFDEGIGRKAFDIGLNGMNAFIFGATFTDDHSRVQNGGMTDEAGFYSIEGINYSAVENFTAIPSKIFYSSYALETNAAYEAYAELTDFDLTDSSTVEIIVHPYDITSRQTILSKGSDFELWIASGNLNLTINGENKVLGPITTTYQHLSLTIDANTDDVLFYRNGSFVASHSFASVGGDWSGDKWILAAKGSTPEYFYTGLIDEVVFYKNLLSIQEIQLNASQFGTGGTNIGHPDLVHYFDLNEGKGKVIEDTGIGKIGDGIVHNASFSIITYNQEAVEHLFRPSQRLVNINPSNTAASGIDFTDESTVTISGVVRFENTFCYQDSVEILVNGVSGFPKIYTNRDGKFVADFEPGRSITLAPKYGKGDQEHKFSPAFYKVRNLNRPIAGVLFANLTKRTIEGQISGGDSRLSIINLLDDDIVRIKVEAANQCYEKELQLEDEDGKFEFQNLPAIPFEVKVTSHSDQAINEFMQLKGGQTKDMRIKMRDTVDFRYYAPPLVWMETFDTIKCANGSSTLYPTIEESGPLNGNKLYKKTIRMYEDYAGGRDWLKNFDLVITNNLNDDDPVNYSIRDTSAFKYEFRVGQANIGGDFTKFLQAVGTSPRGDDNVMVQRAIVLGEKARESSFVTSTPTLPTVILRDPPGDASFSTWEQGTSRCSSISDISMKDFTDTQTQTLAIGHKAKNSMGIGYAVIIELAVINESTFTGTKTTSKVNEKSAEVCITSRRSISTSSGDAVTGDQADIYVGNAINLGFSANDVLWLNPNTCEVKSDSVTVSVDFEGFGTEFIYSEWQILTTVIPNLELVGDTVSANTWRRSVARNKELKKKARLVKNLTFDGLASITETVESSSANSEYVETTVTLSYDFANEIGFLINDATGFKTKFGWVWGDGNTNSTTTTSETSTSISYTLADDDPKDSYTLDVKDDGVFKTPVFQLRAGESMCPWVPGTLNREEIGFQIDRLTAVDVPENEAAVFRVKMINLGQTGRDPLVYMIGLKKGSNPDGAIVVMDGEGLINPVSVQLQAKETKEFLISINRGPDVNKYNYSDIGIFAASQCQFEHTLGLGYNLAAYADWGINNPGVPRPTKAAGIMEGIYNIVDLEKFYKQFRLNVGFQEPCSPINIGFPFQDWVQTPALGDNLTISLNSFINTDLDLELIRVQYRRTGGDGAWLNITEFPKSELNNPTSKNIIWNMSELADGPYEIRAVTQCFSGLASGTSAVIKGRKETKPPKVFGLPQPADGLLNPGDEISITFSKRINCSSIFPADGIGTNINFNNMALQDMTIGGVLIDADFICKDDKIVIIPRIQNSFIENHTLRVTATGIEDLYGNAADQVVWEFYVNGSNLYWHGGDIDEVVLEGNELMVRREIRNQSGQRTSFTIDNYPDWMQIFPVSGALDPGQILPVNFVFPKDLVTSAYSTTVQMSTIDGLEPMKVDLRVACPSPEWNVDPSQYSFSMNLTLQLNIEGKLSFDRLDRVGAFVDGKLRGIGNVQYSRSIDKHLVFLTVYSNIPVGETVTFQIWDASACLLYASTIETFPYVADGLIGSPLDPQVIYTDNKVLRKIDIHPGWNWISYNINLTDPSTNSALSLLTNPSGGLIKSQTEFSTYSIGAGAWLGDLTELSHLTMYQYNSLAYDSIQLIGAPVDQTTPMPLVAGWNWIGYLPQYGLPVTNALQSLNPVNGDIIKSQISFAQYVAGVGWVGNLSFLNTPNGYLLKLVNADTLVYPSLNNGSNILDSETAGKNRKPSSFAEIRLTDIDAKVSETVAASHWSVTPQNYEFSMNAIAIVVNENTHNLLKDGDEVAAFVGNEVRGVGKALYVAALDSYMLFMTMYANKEGELVTFKYYNSEEAIEYPIVNSRGFNINAIWGKVETPVELMLESTVATNDTEYGKEDHMVLFPNPSSYYVYINFTSTIDDEVELTITDLLGTPVMKFKQKAQQGQNVFEWKPELSLPNGLYLVTLKTQKGSYNRFAELMR